MLSTLVSMLGSGNYLLQELISYSIPLLSQRLVPLFPFFWPGNELVEQDGFPVDAAAADVDGDVPQRPDPPLPVSVTHQHLGLHLLAIVVVGASTSTSGIIA